jgi:hypothetical protein
VPAPIGCAAQSAAFSAQNSTHPIGARVGAPVEIVSGRSVLVTGDPNAGATTPMTHAIPNIAFIEVFISNPPSQKATFLTHALNSG